MFKHIAITITVFLLLFFSTNAVFSQSESYLETIYQAIEGDDGQATAPEDPDADTSGVVIETGDGEIEVEVSEGEPEPELTPEQIKVVNILNDLIRILSGQLGGVIPSINLVDLSTPPVEDDPVIDDPVDPDPVDPVDPDPVDPVDPDPVDPVDPDPVDPVDPDPVDPVAPDPVDPVAPDPVDPVIDEASEIVAIKGFIKGAYGINANNGTTEWSMRQLEILEDTLAALPIQFVNYTTDITRDTTVAPGMEDDGQTLAYVKSMEQEIHVLDRAVTLTAAEKAAMEERMRANVEALFIEEYRKQYEEDPPRSIIDKTVDQYIESNFENALVEYVERDLRHTYIHEMTHCFQNSQPAIYKLWRDAFWPNGQVKGSSPSNYGNTYPFEDMAECFAYFLIGGELEDDKFVTYDGNTMDLERYNMVKQMLNNLGGDY